MIILFKSFIRPDIQPAGHPAGYPARHLARHPARHSAGHLAGHPAGHPAGHSAGHPSFWASWESESLNRNVIKPGRGGREPNGPSKVDDLA